ncbi:hypothetical protein V5O48_017099 [Marasmius crinis-equi]|uniref:Uncharacterized protein n=1 Tax=Marasmius crinis-equi TaxID=585013 RepID=A0ABR3EPX6_9AGAR
MREVVRSRNAPGMISGGLSGLGDIQFASPSVATGTSPNAILSQHEYEIPLAEPKGGVIMIKEKSET